MGTQLEFDFYKGELEEVAPLPVLKKKWLEEVTGKTGSISELEYYYAVQNGLSTTASIGSGKDRIVPVPEEE